MGMRLVCHPQPSAGKECMPWESFCRWSSSLIAPAVGWGQSLPPSWDWGLQGWLQHIQGSLWPWSDHTELLGQGYSLDEVFFWDKSRQLWLGLGSVMD